MKWSLSIIMAAAWALPLYFNMVIYEMSFTLISVFIAGLVNSLAIILLVKPNR